MVSSTCRKRRMAASPRVRLPLFSSANAASPPRTIPAPKVAAPATAALPFMNDRRLVVAGKIGIFISFLPQ